MKKALKIIAIVIVVLIVLFFAVLKLAPVIAKNYIVTHSEELIGRKVSIESIGFAPLSFTLGIDKFALLEQDGKTPFVAFEQFRINLDPSKLISGTASVSQIYMKGLYAHVIQNGDKFNFTDILEFLNKNANEQEQDSTQATKDSSNAVNAAEIANQLPVNISIENIVFENGNIIYEDTKVGSKFKLEDFSIGIPAIYLSDKATNAGVSFKFADGGNLNIKADANMATNDIHVEVHLDNFQLASGKPYLNDFINYKDFSGTFSTGIIVDGNLNDILASSIKGSISLKDIVLTETSGKALGVKDINVGIGKVNLAENSFQIDSVIVDGAFAHIDLYKDGTNNIDALLKSDNSKNNDTLQAADNSKESTDSTTKEQPKLKANIGKLLVKNTSASATDLTIIEPFNYTVSGITVSGQNINLETPCSINVAATFPEGGSATVNYKGSFNDMGTMDAFISVKNLALKHFSNYSLHYTGYPITGGTMAFASENKMSNFNIESKNTIDIYNIEVGDKDSKIDPEFTVPMKVGLYILKDKNDKIQFDIPVKGNMKDPEFSILKIVWKTVMNLLIKVAVSPLKIAGNIATTGANVVGLDLGNDDEIVLDPLSESFGSEQFAKAINMTKALENDSKLKLSFTQYYNPTKTMQKYKQYKLKTEFYKITKNKSNLNEIDKREILEISDSDEAYSAYAKEATTKITENDLLQELSAMAEKRNQEMLKVLKQQPSVNDKNVVIKTAPAKDLKGHNRKAMYKVNVDVQ